VHAAIFKAYDIRGVVETALTESIAYQIGRAQAVTAGLVDSGIDVIDIGLVPSPLLYFAAQTLANGSGVMITGSHNPPEYNGIKMQLANKVIAGKQIEQLKTYIKEKCFITGTGSVEFTQVQEPYWQAITNDIRLSRPMNIIVDAGNGAAGPFAPTLYRRLGCEVKEIFCDVDGHFPNHHPDPAVLSNLTLLKTALHETQTEVGLAFDGDADRLGVVTKEGKVIFADRVMMLLAADILSRHPGATIAYDVKSSRLLEAWIKNNGGHPLLIPTGHSNLKQAIQEKNALLAGEFSGHFCIKERWFGFDDGIYAGARLLEILSQVENSSALLSALPESVSTPELFIPLTEGEPKKVIAALMKKNDFSAEKCIVLDGLRVEYNDGFGLVRASNTVPSLTLRFEADTQQAMEKIMTEFRANLIPLVGNNLPF
jgi:phosphomannomutase/phosphoglucomutase